MRKISLINLTAQCDCSCILHIMIPQASSEYVFVCKGCGKRFIVNHIPLATRDVLEVSAEEYVER